MKIYSKKPFLHCVALALISVLLFSSFSPVAIAENNDDKYITVTQSFQLPIIEEENGFTKIVVEGLSGSGNPGEPNLPVKQLTIPLPLDAMVVDISAIGEQKYFGEGFIVEPVGEPVPLSEDIETVPITPDENIYSSEEMFPGKLFENAGIQHFRGYDILILTLFPIQYIPASGKLYYYEEITVSIKITERQTQNQLYRGLEKDSLALAEKIDATSVSYPETEPPRTSVLSDGYDMLILTIDGFVDEFRPLADAHNATGINTSIKTLSDIGINPDVEDIRDFIRDEYTTNGIEYVLLGGDDHVIPAKELYFGVLQSEDIFGPSDLYYACLDGPFNNDGDDKWGESNDGEGGGDVDLTAEVYVGRACVSSSSEATTFVEKTVDYIEAGDEYLGRVLMVGENLAPIEGWGGDHMDELIGGSSAHGYTTVGIPSEYAISTLYERDEGEWSKSEIMSRINNGLYIIDHLGHGQKDKIMKIYSSDVSSLTNTVTCFIYSQACSAGEFDDYDCFAEYITVKTDNGAFAVIANTRHGWATSGTTDGPSHRYNREFWDAIFGEHKGTIGRANQDSKEDNLYRIDDESMRWCYYEITLFGDPALEFYDPLPTPVIKIEDIKGGLGVSANIKNTGSAGASNIDWSISIEGGALGRIDYSTDDTIDSLAIGSEEEVETPRSVIGFGRVNITVTAQIPGEAEITKQEEAFVLGCLIVKLPERIMDFLEQVSSS